MFRNWIFWSKQWCRKFLWRHQGMFLKLFWHSSNKKTLTLNILFCFCFVTWREMEERWIMIVNCVKLFTLRIFLSIKPDFFSPSFFPTFCWSHTAQFQTNFSSRFFSWFRYSASSNVSITQHRTLETFHYVCRNIMINTTWKINARFICHSQIFRSDFSRFCRKADCYDNRNKTQPRLNLFKLFNFQRSLA